MGVVNVWAVAALALGVPAPQETSLDWRQGIEYRIESRLDEEAQVLEGRGRILYRNDSPDTLRAFYLHLYLNAFRPNSAWARRDLEHGIRTFQDLGPDEHGFERVRELTVDGQRVLLRYPFAPDSTVVGMELGDPLEPGETLAIDVRWDARPSSVPRRQGRQGRQWDLAQWYPRVVVYDEEGWRIHPLYRAGEFYGEFATYDVTLDVAEDQVIGATGVPVEGDPGWEGAAALGTGPVDHQREWYGSLAGPPCVERAGERICGAYPARRLEPAEPLGHLDPEPEPGRKRVRWYAEDVHHFAWSTSPDYVYEQGRWEDIAIRVLYRPGDEETWGGGIAVRRTAAALQWLDSIFGDYVYPQVTNLHRIESGGTEFPMLIMDGSASQSLILHEVGHIYAHGILANNEWYEGWLDEGMSTFQTAWFAEREGDASAFESRIRTTVLNDVTGVSQPVVLRAEDYATQGIYSAAIYTKGAVILWMLREMVGEESMVEILRTWYDRYQLRHVDSESFQRVAEEVTRRDLDWFFGPWLHTTGVVDYALEDVSVRSDGAGGWITTFEVRKVGELRMPVPVRLSGGGERADTVVDGQAPRRTVTVRSTFRPDEVGIDPEGRILDWNPSNDGWAAGFFASGPGRDEHLDDPTRPLPVRLDAVQVGFFPLAWVNDAGGWVAGLQARSSLLGLSNGTIRLGLPAIPAGAYGEGGDADVGSVWVRSSAPMLGDRPAWGLELEAFAGEGRSLLRGSWERPLGRPLLGASAPRGRLFATAAAVRDEAYLVPGRWNTGRRSAAELGAGLALEADALGLGWSLDGSGAAGFDTDAHRWVRGSVAAAGERELGGGWGFAARLFGGGAVGTDDPEGEGTASGDRVPAERRFFLSSVDPWSTIGNPWTRSAGSPLDDRGVHDGGGTLRGFDPRLSLAWIATASLELSGPAWRPAAADIELRPSVFAGAGTGARAGLPPLDGSDDARLDAATFLWSAGVGVRLARPGSPLGLRVDLPVVLSHPSLARDARDARAGLRVQVGFGG